MHGKFNCITVNFDWHNTVFMYVLSWLIILDGTYKLTSLDFRDDAPGVDGELTVDSISLFEKASS